MQQASLMYGHGANAFATYPGITRARQQNHLWLPLAVLEDEQTQARLGAVRSEKERLERAVDAFARFLGQSRPDGMVSDLLHEPPAPARLPAQCDLAAEEARAESERRLAQARMARAKSVSLSPRQAHDEAQRREAAARAEEKVKALLARIEAGADERAVPSWKSRIYGGLSPQDLDWKIAEGDRGAVDADKDAVQAAAINAVEAAAHATVQTNNKNATLGTMLGEIRNARHKFEVAISTRSGEDPITPVETMMRALWQGQTSRHGGQVPTVPETLEAARAGVHLAAAPVQWFVSGAVVRNP
ncbi:hypothetical protein [Streptomyces sp. NPDC005078]|uniref:hypothetical protein n=1 Tax=unclassified Streptomyces TaxID=2593676 RepID=UPI0033A51A16